MDSVSEVSTQLCELGFEKRDSQWTITAERLGEQLELVSPRIAVMKIFNRHRTELEPYSCVTILVTEAGRRATTAFTEHGAYIIAMLAKTPKAAEFRQKVANILVARRKLIDAVQESFETSETSETRIPPHFTELSFQEQNTLLRKINSLLEDKLDLIQRVHTLVANLATAELQAAEVAEADEKWMSLRVISNLTGITTRTLSQWCREGKVRWRASYGTIGRPGYHIEVHSLPQNIRELVVTVNI